MTTSKLQTSEDWENLTASIGTMFANIKKKTFANLEDGGDGSGHRVINRAKFNVDDIINGPPVHIPQK